MILVKGMTRRVVVVKSPDKRLFEEAVFFLCDDAEHGVSSDQIIAEAQSIANGFTRDSCRMRRTVTVCCAPRFGLYSEQLRQVSSGSL